MKLNHLGYITKDVHATIDAFLKLGYTKMHDELKIHIPKNLANMRVKLGDAIVEIMSINDPSKPSFIDEGFKTTTEPFSLHHICYDVDDIHKTFEKLMATGEYTVFEAITNGVHQKNLIGFLKHKQIGYIEFFEWPKE